MKNNAFIYANNQLYSANAHILNCYALNATKEATCLGCSRKIKSQGFRQFHY